MVSREQPHIIAICEVKPKNGAERLIQEFSIDGYLDFSTNLDTHKGRGMIILIHASISNLVLKINPLPVEEACVLEIKLKKKDILLFACVYRSPTDSATPEGNNSNINK